jgi:hypothetical protein
MRSLLALVFSIAWALPCAVYAQTSVEDTLSEIEESWNERSRNVGG